MSQTQTAINASCARWLAQRLELAGHQGDANVEAELIVRELLAQGLAVVPRPFPLRPTAPPASPASIASALQATAVAVATAKERGGR